MNAATTDPAPPAATSGGGVVLGDEPLDVWAGRFASGDLFAWLAGPATSARGCSRPVRLVGRTTTTNPLTGQVVDSFDTADLPDGVLYKPCGSRLASVCAACAHVYRYDTYHLIAAGLRGGKGVPESVASHPAIFATFTAPGFGPVHTASAGRSGSARFCRPRRDFPVCRHGKAMSCRHRHDDGERLIGAPFCLDCYDHDHQIAWNHFAPKLWARTMDRLVRLVAKLAKAHGVWAKLRFAKVAEFQARGALHFHALFRLDGHNPDNPKAILPPPPEITAAMLIEAIRQAAADTAVLTPPHPDRQQGWPIAWGEQLDLRIVREGLGEDTLTERHVAGYLAKYATKSTETLGAAIPPLTEGYIGVYTDPGTHLGRLVGSAWRLGRLDAGAAYRRLRPKAHMLGFAGHFSTKSHRYSTTLTALRAARRPAERDGVRVISPDDYDRAVHLEHDDDGDADALVLVLQRHWTYAGTGWLTFADEQLALAAAAAARSHRTG